MSERARIDNMSLENSYKSGDLYTFFNSSKMKLSIVILLAFFYFSTSSALRSEYQQFS